MPADDCSVTGFGPVGGSGDPAVDGGIGGGSPNAGQSTGLGGTQSGGFFGPDGANSLFDKSITHKARMQLFYQGDELRGRWRVPFPPVPGGLATAANSKLVFRLSDMRFVQPDHTYWLGEWAAGITEIEPGLAEVLVPAEVTDYLRRGSYMYTLTVSEPLGTRRRTLYEGYLLVEYSANSPNPDIPYRHSPPGPNVQNVPNASPPGSETP